MFCSLLLRSYWQVPGSQDGDVDAAPDKILAKAQNRFNKNMPDAGMSSVPCPVQEERRTVEITNLYFVKLIYYEIMTNNNGNVMIELMKIPLKINLINSCLSSSVIHM